MMPSWVHLMSRLFLVANDSLEAIPLNSALGCPCFISAEVVGAVGAQQGGAAGQQEGGRSGGWNYDFIYPGTTKHTWLRGLSFFLQCNYFRSKSFSNP